MPQFIVDIFKIINIQIHNGKRVVIALCPVQLGAALSDIAHEIATGRRVATGPVMQPALALGPLALAARALGMTIRVEGVGAVTLLMPEGPAFGALPDEAASLAVSRTEEGAAPLCPSPLGRAVDRSAWESLTRLAARTYVPATAESRLSGAGAGLADND